MGELRYEDANLDERILQAVREIGFEVMTPIQAKAIPEMLQGRDLIGQAQTGTGKTASFGIPIIQKIDPELEALQALILCPTRELAIQAAEEIRKYAKYIPGIRVLPVYGGQDITKQIRSLKGNVQVVVGTPGRVMDHMRRHTMKLDDIRTIVLDEADEMLDMGFREDIETILKETPEERQTALFSATMPKPILEITKQYQKSDAVFLKMPAKELTIPLVKQYYYEVSRQGKVEAVSRLLDKYNPERSLIFCNTKRMVDELAEALIGRGYFAEALHGDLAQMQRDRVMQSFRQGQTEILIATDVAARGIDVDNVEAVLNYDIPQDVEYYVHRIGRTGRAGKKGRAFTLVVGRDIYKIREIERYCNTRIEARQIPSSVDVRYAKSEKILNNMLALREEEDLSEMIRMVEQKLNDEDCTALELAAAFLRVKMGDYSEALSDEELLPERWENTDRKRRRRGSGRDRREDREGRSGGRDRRDREGRRGFKEKEERKFRKDKEDREDYGKKDKDRFEDREDYGKKKDKDGRRDRSEDWEDYGKKNKDRFEDWEDYGKKDKEERKSRKDKEGKKETHFWDAVYKDKKKGKEKSKRPAFSVRRKDRDEGKKDKKKVRAKDIGKDGSLKKSGKKGGKGLPSWYR
ncbi:MAG: DEAD/DEAH box helicase [Lachnospiraceae bacterium]|nr:DEAD/DEAH box helicase [Lachnospiraceae bacterium]